MIDARSWTSWGADDGLAVQRLLAAATKSAGVDVTAQGFRHFCACKTPRRRPASYLTAKASRPPRPPEGRGSGRAVLTLREVMLVIDTDAANRTNSLVVSPQYSPGFALRRMRTISAPDMAMGCPCLLPRRGRTGLRKRELFGPRVERSTTPQSMVPGCSGPPQSSCGLRRRLRWNSSARRPVGGVSPSWSPCRPTGTVTIGKCWIRRSNQPKWDLEPFAIGGRFGRPADSLRTRPRSRPMISPLTCACRRAGGGCTTTERPQPAT